MDFEVMVFLPIFARK